MLEKQYSVKFFTSFIEAIQKVCRDYLDFEQGVELSGYLAVEIDNIKKERYVLSEFVQSSGNVISESFCTKAFKTVPKSAPTPEHRVLKEHNTSSGTDLMDSYGQEQASINRRTYLPGGYSSNQRHTSSGYANIRSSNSQRSQSQIQPRSSTAWISSPDAAQSPQANTSGRSSFPGSHTHIGFESSDRGFKRNATDSEESPSLKIARSSSIEQPLGSSSHTASETHSNPEYSQSAQSGVEDSVRLPLSAKVKEEEEDDDDVTLIESISDFGKGDETVSFGGDYSDILRDDGAGSSQNMYMQLSTSGEKVELFKAHPKKAYTQSAFIEALRVVTECGVSIRKAGRMYNIPHQTLHDHIRGRRKKQRAEIDFSLLSEDHHVMGNPYHHVTGSPYHHVGNQYHGVRNRSSHVEDRQIALSYPAVGDKPNTGTNINQADSECSSQLRHGDHSEEKPKFTSRPNENT